MSGPRVEEVAAGREKRVYDTRLRVAGLALAVVISLATWLFWQGSNLQTAMVLAVGGAVTILAYVYWGELLAPAVLWLGIWTVGLSLGQLHVWLRSSFSGPWSAELWFALLGAAAMFVAGTLVVGRPHGARVQAPLWKRRNLDAVILTCFVVGFATYAYSVIQAGGVQAIPLFSTRPAEMRQTFGVRGTSYFLLLMAAVVPLTTTSVLFHGGWRTNKQNIALSALAVVLFLTTANRSIALEVLSISYFAIAITRGISIRATLTALLAFAVIFLLIGLARTINNPLDTTLFSSAYIGISNPLLAMGYIYFGTAFNNLQYIFDTVSQMGYGGIMLRAPLTALGFEDFIRLPVINWDAWNTTTALANYYYDFGIVGILIIPFGLGIVAGRIHSRARQSISPLYAMLYGIAATCIVMSVFTDRFFEGTTLLYIAVALVARKTCARPQPDTGGKWPQPIPPAASFNRLQ